MSKLIVICGLSFAGKSTLADAICGAYGCAQVDVDVTIEQLYGPGVADDDFAPEDWDRIYADTDGKIAALLHDGDSVVDASRNFQRFERDRARAIARKMKAEFVLIHVDTPEEIARHRWAANRAKQTRRDVRDEAFDQIIAVMEPPTADERSLVFHHDDSIDHWISEHAKELA